MEMDFSFIVIAMLFVNGAILGICVCRLKEMNDKVLARVKYQYIVGCMVSAANGLAPIFFRQWPTTTGLFFALWVFYVFWSDSYQWKNGPPSAALKLLEPIKVPDDIQ